MKKELITLWKKYVSEYLELQSDGDDLSDDAVLYLKSKIKFADFMEWLEQEEKTKEDTSKV